MSSSLVNETHPNDRPQHRYSAVGLHYGCVVGVSMDCVKQSGWQSGGYTRVSQEGGGGRGRTARPHTSPIKGNHRVIITEAIRNFTPGQLLSSTAEIHNCT
jgi:hypothetical protein